MAIGCRTTARSIGANAANNWQAILRCYCNSDVAVPDDTRHPAQIRVAGGALVAAAPLSTIRRPEVRRRRLDLDGPRYGQAQPELRECRSLPHQSAVPRWWPNPPDGVGRSGVSARQVIQRQRAACLHRAGRERPPYVHDGRDDEDPQAGRDPAEASSFASVVPWAISSPASRSRISSLSRPAGMGRRASGAGSGVVSRNSWSGSSKCHSGMAIHCGVPSCGCAKRRPAQGPAARSRCRCTGSTLAGA